MAESGMPHDGDEGGDPACWVQNVCPACGLLVEGRLPERCPRCGTALEETGPLNA